MSPTKWDVFLSHAGEDHQEADRLVAWINQQVRGTPGELRVFNTSSPENRFHEFQADVGGRTHEYALYRDELKSYIADNMIASRVYLLLATPWSIAKRSEWITFEIETALHLRERGGLIFVPCVANGARVRDLPENAFAFVGADLSFAGGLNWLRDQLLSVVGRARDEDRGPPQQLTGR
jgi:hypothetical protein